MHIHETAPSAPSATARSSLDQIDLSLYSHVSKKLANLVCKAKSVQELREICGVAADGFTDADRQKNFDDLQRYVV